MSEISRCPEEHRTGAGEEAGARREHAANTLPGEAPVESLTRLSPLMLHGTNRALTLGLHTKIHF